MKVIYEKPKVFTDSVTTYCGGCGHGIVGKLIGELIDEMGLQENGIGADQRYFPGGFNLSNT